MTTNPTLATVKGLSFLSRFLGYQRQQATVPTTKVAYSIPAGVMLHALFDPGAPLSDLTGHEKARCFGEIEERLDEIGWSVKLSSQALDMRDREYQRKLRSLLTHGGKYVEHIKRLIDRAHDYHQAKKHLGGCRHLPAPWPMETVKISCAGCSGCDCTHTKGEAA